MHSLFFPHYLRHRKFAVLLFSLLAPSLALAQLSESQRSTLLSATLSAKYSLSETTLPSRDRANEAFLRDARSTQNFLQANTSVSNGEAWLNYLELDALREAVNEDASVATQGNLAVALHERLIGIAPGLELRTLVQLRRSVSELIASLRYSDAEKSISQLERQLDAFEKRLGEFESIPTADDVASLGAVISVLREAKQAPSAVATIRSVFDEPNAVLTLNGSLVQQTVNRAVNQSRPVSNCILGTRLVGMASLNGSVTATLQPSIGAALLSVSLQGRFHATNRGYNGPVVLNTTGTGQVFASRNLLLNESGVTMQPAHVQVQLASSIDSIEHRLKIVRRIAKKKAAEQKPQADRIATEKLRAEVSEQFVRETSQSSSMQVGDPLAKVRPWLGRLDLVEPTRLWGSTHNAIFIQGSMRRDDQLGSLMPAPPVSGVYDIAIQIHETLIDNALTPMLAGRTVNQSQIEPLLSLTGNAPASTTKSNTSRDSLALDDDTEDGEEPSFEIDFARTRPVIFEARDGVLRVGVRGTRFSQGRRELSRAMEITTTYTPARDSSGNFLLLRDSEVDVDFPGRGRLTIAQSAIKPAIQKSFGEVFPQVLGDQPFLVPAEAPLDAIRGKTLRPSQITANDGWLTVGVR